VTAGCSAALSAARLKAKNRKDQKEGRSGIARGSATPRSAARAGRRHRDQKLMRGAPARLLYKSAGNAPGRRAIAIRRVLQSSGESGAKVQSIFTGPGAAEQNVIVPHRIAPA